MPWCVCRRRSSGPLAGLRNIGMDAINATPSVKVRFPLLLDSPDRWRLLTGLFLFHLS